MKTNYLKACKVTFITLFLMGFCSLAQSQQENFGCIDPVISDTSGPGAICEGETATLTATHNGDGVNWFDAPSGGNLVGSGSPFVTNPLTTTTSFWAEAFNGGSGTVQTGGARVAPTNTTASAVVAVTSPWGLAFDASEDFTINSVDVYLASSDPGDVVVQLKDSGLNILEQVTIAAPAGNSTTPVQFTLNLDFFVPAGTDYNLVAESSPVMVREFSSGHPGFPYPIGTSGSVFGGTINDNDTNPNVYYFFYNWSFTPGVVCTSARVEEAVTVSPMPAIPVGDSVQQFSSGETLADLDVTGENLMWYSDAGGTISIPDTTPLVDGTTYYVSQTVGGCESDLLAITVELILGVDDASLENLAYYPNPVTSLLTISNSEAIKSIKVMNMLGQVIIYDAFDSNTVSLDLSILNSGFYLMDVFTERGKKTVEILKN
ncbi:putative secreted protein (Por secretion system target) [Ulvibacter sp. MAR_2010_11]|uniref:Ig-like domain-containing protein n=1 Tax=Ulvibacter sp. MAR_2010_11 TaxID=1250229 RepID=UPI000C2BB390|nr:T9SS type A sorting domain-containing protein [Ulvibacter sp. MAR_2010_11]PKA84602.1 putative secreted protein (Por secretion system target) [Ulvibacter sp. MAR_2010_11]